MHRVYQSLSTPVPPQFLLCAPKIAGLLPARAESLKAHNPPSLTLTDYRLESIPPDHYHALLNATRMLFSAAVDFLVTQDEEAEDDLHLMSLDFASELSELFEPIIEVIKKSPPPAKPKKERILTKEAMDADLEPFLKNLRNASDYLGKLTKPQGKGGAA